MFLLMVPRGWSARTFNSALKLSAPCARTLAVIDKVAKQTVRNAARRTLNVARKSLVTPMFESDGRVYSSIKWALLLDRERGRARAAVLREAVEDDCDGRQARHVLAVRLRVDHGRGLRLRESRGRRRRDARGDEKESCECEHGLPLLLLRTGGVRPPSR